MMRFIFSVLLFSISMAAFSQPPHSAYQDLKYRLIGPFRAGRTVGAAGIPSQPNVFYIGVNNGGVWKTDDYGRTWKPIFDEAPTGSVGDIAVSPSHPEVIYVGTGEGLHRPDLSVGDGIYKSSDGGKTWQHVGLKDVQQVSRLIVHPTNPNYVFVAGLGHPYGVNETRGVFRSKDGGKNWEKVLYIDHNTGAMQVEFDPTNPDILYADMWEHREGPWENASFSGKNNGLYKSTDGGTTWRMINKGLPTPDQGLGRIGVGIAPGNPNRIYATVDARENGGIYRSDDAGESWTLIQRDPRLWGRGADFAEVKVHPKNPDVVYVGNIASYKSTDGGKTWTSMKGAPGGDDYHRIWINPQQPDVMLFATDQGATITVNGGKTWSSWYNQPTAQLYHVITDNQFPYWVYGGQQESGGIGISSRGNGGQISLRDWIGVGSDEYAYVAPDPKNPDIIYGGRVMRHNRKTGQTQLVAPEPLRSGQYRYVRTMPLLFHPADDNMLLFATNVLWKTLDGGAHWEIISPDLTRKQPEVPGSIGDYITPDLNTMPQRGVIYAIGPSPLDKNMIWAGTDDGLVHVTSDGGKTWKDVTPSAIASWDKIAQIDAGHFDKNTAYIAVNAMRKDDMRPHIFRTHDGGASWEEITRGMNSMGPVNVVREDPRQKGLLFAGTETEVYFSIDDGAYWQSLRLNMPPSSIRDLVIHEDDLVVGTHGRSIWILDNISPLRELASAVSSTQPYLFKPVVGTRVRDNMFYDTPFPPEEPMGQNPPDGVTLDYFLPQPSKDLTLEILDQSGKTLRKYSSTDKPEYLDSTKLPHPTYWIKPLATLSAEAGHHRFVWDLRHAPPRGAQRGLPISAVYKNTASIPRGPFVHPGTYTVRLTADGKKMEHALQVRLDPRVNISEKDLQRHTDYSMECYNSYHQLQTIRETINTMLNDHKRKWKKNQKENLLAFMGKGQPENADLQYGSIRETPLEKETLAGLQEKYLYMLELLQSADATPTSQTVKGIERLREVFNEMREKWQRMK